MLYRSAVRHRNKEWKITITQRDKQKNETHTQRERGDERERRGE
jgi:hypothetical protein